MCGIFGSTAPEGPHKRSIETLIKHAEQRGRDSSGLVVHRPGEYRTFRADFTIEKLLRRVALTNTDVFIGHSRLITNETSDNQPVVRDGIAVVHNGIIVNHEELWETIARSRELTVDSEIIPALLATQLDSGASIGDAVRHALSVIKGVAACAVIIPKLGKLVLFSNNGSLYAGEKSNGIVFSSERYPLEQIEASSIRQVRDPEVIDITAKQSPIGITEWKQRTVDLVPGLSLTSAEENLLSYPTPDFKRCTKCILPETMPFIKFDEHGVCNYCTSYKIRNHPRPKEELFELVEPYRRAHGDEVLVPFSGGRDSCYALHLIVDELKLKPITYTYDWGMVTDLGRRNISRMSSALGVENIIVAPDITKKRDYIRRNLNAWLKAPNLGMLSVLTAGDKHFFRHIESVKKQTGLSLNLWGINPLEATHFKSGFLRRPTGLRRRARLQPRCDETASLPEASFWSHDEEPRLLQPVTRTRSRASTTAASPRSQITTTSSTTGVGMSSRSTTPCSTNTTGKRHQIRRPHGASVTVPRLSTTTLTTR